MMEYCEELCQSTVIRDVIVNEQTMQELLHRATNHVDATIRKKTK